jgi:hypothetical protein
MEKELSSRRTVLHDLFSTGHQGSSNYLSFINSGVVLPQHLEHPGFSIFFNALAMENKSLLKLLYGFMVGSWSICSGIPEKGNLTTKSSLYRILFCYLTATNACN